MEHNAPYLQAALLCEGVTTDAEGRHNIHNEFTQYTMGYSQPFTILTIWRGADETPNGANYQERTEIIAPDGRVVAAGENGPFALENTTFRQVNSILLENVDFTNEGVYEMRLTLTDSANSVITTASYPITVV